MSLTNTLRDRRVQRENNTVILLEKTSWRERDPNGTWDDGEALERKGEKKEKESFESKTLGVGPGNRHFNSHNSDTCSSLTTTGLVNTGVLSCAELLHQC